MHRLHAIAAVIDRLVRAAADAAPAALWVLVYAAALGSGTHALFHPGAVALLDRNQLHRTEALRMALTVGTAALGLAMLHVGFILLQHARARRAGLDLTKPRDLADTLNGALRPVLALPLLQALSLPGVERDRPMWTLLVVAAISAVAVASAHAWIPLVRGSAPSARRETALRLGAPLFVACLWAGYALFFSRLSIVNHHALNTRTVSLGYYDNIFYHSAHGDPLGCSFMKAGYHGSAHFDPILVAFAPLYLLHPRAELLLVLQSVWLGAGVVPVYLLARERRASRAAAATLAALYALYPAVHGANLYEFHSLTLAVPLTLWLLYFLERGASVAYWITLAATLLVREDMPFLTCFVGAYALSSSVPRATRTGWLTIAASVAYFAAVKRWGMTSPDVFMTGNNAYAFAFNYEDMIPNHDGATGMLVSLVTNPLFVIGTMVSEPKARHVLMLFVPLCFLPAVARPGRIMLVWGLLFALLATRPLLHSIYSHYPSHLVPILFALAPTALRRIEDEPMGRAAPGGPRLARAILIGAVVASLLCSWKFGGLVPNDSFRAGYLPVARSLDAQQRETYAWVREQAERIPRDARVGVTNRIGAHAANRSAVFLYPAHDDVDWLFVDEGDLRGATLDRHLEAVSAGFDVVAKRGTLAVYRRR